MADYDLQYTGQQVDEALGKILDGTIDAAVNRAINAGDIATAAAAQAVPAAQAAVPAAAQAVASATESKSWAVGGTGSRTGEDTDNAKYYASVAREIAGGDYTTPTEARGIANEQIDARAAKLYDATHPYAAGEWCVHVGEVWKNTSGGTVTGVEPGTNYNVWNVGFSNPNLLDNADFRNPVNQRVATTWTSGFGIDRWHVVVGNVSVGNKCLILNTDGYLCQTIEAELLNYLRGKVITFSVLYTNGHLQAFTFTVPLSGSVDVKSSSSYFGVRPMMYVGGEKKEFDLFAQGISSAVWIDAVKVELGPISTLANDGPPDYGTELAKCQGYFVRLSSNYNGNGDYWAIGQNAAGSTQTRVVVQLPVTMWKKPTVSAYNIVDATGAPVTVDYVGWGTQASNMYTIVLNSGSTVLSPLAMLRFGANGYVDFSADL